MKEKGEQPMSIKTEQRKVRRLKGELVLANTELAFQEDEKRKRADELTLANKELAFQKDEKRKRAEELVLANNELAFQVSEKRKRAEELTLANNELAFQEDEKRKRAEELVLANNELAFQVSEKRKRAAELTLANTELAILTKQYEKAEILATHDQLTGLPNRILLRDRINQNIYLAKRTKTRTALMTLDLDAFKQINDTYGHHAGDIVLKSIAKRLTGLLRDTDTIARLGGDEFVLLATQAKSNQDIKTLANRVLKIVQEPIVVGKQKITVGISIGIAWYPSNGRTGKTIMKYSDKALYAAKEQGGNCYAIWGIK
ncbi:MAG: diguanylate cyclase [Anaerolineae bacterium]|nr:diguanylate cyclase [Anaerolineae bacterium]MBT7073267.1 diguanylate cyclase [Anaerolineae bacterium]MBT7324113.1 diguanylate cyclase [Anaerolineae bacterium]